MKILILCTGNSCRSMMAQGFLTSFDDNLEVFSAGTNPAAEVHPKAIHVMDELGVDIRKSLPNHVDSYINYNFDYVITVCDGAREKCPVFTGSVNHYLHISFEDPAAAIGSEKFIFEVFRKVRDEIQEKFHHLYNSEIKPQ